METPEQKGTQEEQQETPAQKPKAKWPLVTAIAGGAVICVGLIVGVVMFNARQNDVPVTAELSAASSSWPTVEDNTEISVVSKDGHNIADNPFAVSSQASQGSEGSQKSDASQKESSRQSSKKEDITFGGGVTVLGVNLKGKTLAESYSLLQKTVWDMRDPVSISVYCDGRRVQLTQDDFTYQSDLSDVLLEAYHYSRKEISTTECSTTTSNGMTDFSVDCWLDESSISEALQKVYDAYDEPPVDACVAAFHPNEVEKFTYADGKDGYMVDHKELTDKVKKIIRSNTKTGTVELTKKKTAFTVTLEDVKANTKLIASHFTTAANVYNSNYNMGLALQAASGTILQPGDVFSFNTMTGDTTNGYTHYYDNGTVGGYLPSTAIVGGKYEQQYGGGICQASTTLYICAMKAGLQAIERYSHAYPSVYCQKGLDATIDYGSLDMRFKNTLNMPVYIATYVYDFDYDGLNELCVEMYGPLSTEYDEVVPVGWVDYAGSYSFSAKAAQVFFKNGKEIKRTFLPSGSYDYKYDSYYSVLNEMPYDTENGPSVSPTNQVPTVYSPGGCGSSAPIPYGTAEAYLKKIEDAKKHPESSKQESSKQESSKQESSKQESSKQESSKQESSKQESSKQESSKQESSKQESSKQESSKQESSKQESSKQESSKQESSKQESSKQESSKQESSKQESSKQESSKQESSKQESSKQESSKQESSKQESSKQESSKQESSKQESSKQESSEPTSSEPVSETTETTEATSE